MGTLKEYTDENGTKRLDVKGFVDKAIMQAEEEADAWYKGISKEYPNLTSDQKKAKVPEYLKLGEDMAYYYDALEKEEKKMNERGLTMPDMSVKDLVKNLNDERFVRGMTAAMKWGKVIGDHNLKGTRVYKAMEQGFIKYHQVAYNHELRADTWKEVLAKKENNIINRHESFCLSCAHELSQSPFFQNPTEKELFVGQQLTGFHRTRNNSLIFAQSIRTIFSKMKQTDSLVFDTSHEEYRQLRESMEKLYKLVNTAYDRKDKTMRVGGYDVKKAAELWQEVQKKAQVYKNYAKYKRSINKNGKERLWLTMAIIENKDTLDLSKPTEFNHDFNFAAFEKENKTLYSNAIREQVRDNKNSLAAVIFQNSNRVDAILKDPKAFRAAQKGAEKTI